MRVYLYRRVNGRCPFEDYMEDIDDKHHRSFIHALIDKLAQQEGMLYPPHAKKVREKIWELRSPRGHRIFYFIDEHRDAIILDGYTKKAATDRAACSGKNTTPLLSISFTTLS